jgi:hypothetical protein
MRFRSPVPLESGVACRGVYRPGFQLGRRAATRIAIGMVRPVTRASPDPPFAARPFLSLTAVWSAFSGWEPTRVGKSACIAGFLPSEPDVRIYRIRRSSQQTLLTD